MCFSKCYEKCFKNEYAFGAKVLRLAFGILFIMVAIKKFRMGYGGFANGLVNPAEPTLMSQEIPAFLLYTYGYILPGLELLVGVALITNLQTRYAYMAVALIYLSFIFGQMYNLNTSKIGTEYFPALVALALTVFMEERSKKAS